MIQETLLTEKSRDISTPGYSFIRKDRGRRGGGLAFLIKENIPFQIKDPSDIIKNDPHLEYQSISIKGKQEDLILKNIYIPPVSSCQTGYNPPLQELFLTNDNQVIIGGDFNAHHENWYSNGEEDNRGRTLADEINNTTLGILNENEDTRVTRANRSSPDITLATPAILPYITWKTETNLTSDHLPITISLKAQILKIKSEDKVYINFAKADWVGFKEYTEEKFSRLPTPTNSIKGEKAFRRILNNASKKFIPKGRINNIHHNIPSATSDKISERDDLRKQDPNNARIDELNEEINKEINTHRRQKWLDHLEECEQGSQKFWKTVKDLKEPSKRVENIAIKFNGKPVSENKRIANLLNRQYTPSIDKKPSQSYRATIRKLKSKRNATAHSFSNQQTKKAIKASKSSKAMGPDDISPIMLKHLGDKGINFLTGIYNVTINTAIIPTIWKTGKIIPLLKPKKQIDEGKSYRPISLLSPAAKILEKLILPELSEAINLKDHQHGFRKHRSTVTALQEVNHHIASGLNKFKPCDRTVLVALDLSRAFDTVDHEQLFADILDLELSTTLKKFLCSYLRGRQQYTVFRNCRSKFRVVRQGVPQGGVLSPLLFNLYMSSMPLPPGKILLVSYADDCQVLNSDKKIRKACEEMNPYLNQLADWFQSRRLEISAEKSTATVFTTFSNEVSEELPININGQQVPTVRHPKILGVTFDGMLNFGEHTRNTKKKVSQRNNVLKCIAGTTWGKSKEVIANTYKAIGRSVINYAASVWTPSLSKSNWQELENAQNGALRIATGCVKMTPTSHLNEETEILPVKEHSELLTDQFLLSMHRPHHPNHHLLHATPKQRDMRNTILDNRPKIQKYLTQNPLSDTVYKRKLKTIHKDIVKGTISNYPANKVLSSHPPKVNTEEEKSLPRITRSTLAQLRSGYSSHLNCYLHRINAAETDRCPKCNIHEHTSLHLFDCPSNPTQLEVKDLWKKPKATAEFLGLTIDVDPA